ncbi:hypothetical protein CP8484711_1522 [Chlamydia psittaci 84-8471/1]|nr:hypothetical protein CP8484711_1522 [Chlamydia psittaci 84-8471/1]
MLIFLKRNPLLFQQCQAQEWIINPLCRELLLYSYKVSLHLSQEEGGPFSFCNISFFIYVRN